MFPFVVLLCRVTSQPILHGVKYRPDIVLLTLGMELGLEQRNSRLFSPSLLLLLFPWETEELLSLKLQPIWPL